MTAVAKNLPRSVQMPAENQYGHTKKLRFILDAIEGYQLQSGRPARVLDVGCGNGAAVSQYIIATGCDYLGIDIHQPSLGHAKSHFGTDRARFSTSVPEGAQFDVIVYSDFLEHVADPAGVMRDHVRWLIPGGIVIGSVPNGYGPFEIEQWIDRTFWLSRMLAALSRLKRRLLGQPAPSDPVELPYNHDSGHLVFFTRGMLTQCAAAAALKVRRFSHGAFIGASITGILIGRSSRLQSWNTNVADHLPYWLVSTWYFVFEKTSAGR